MSYWGKVIGGVAGFAVGGPIGAVFGAALGHAADSGGISTARLPFSADTFNPARVAAMFGRRDQLFAITVVVLAAKIAKCDGPVKREEIDAFKRQFRIPPESVRDIGRLFDQARDSPDSFEPYATQLADAFADNRGVLEDVLYALAAVARADGGINVREQEFLRRVHTLFGLDRTAWDRVQSGTTRQQAPSSDEANPYSVLGVARNAPDEVLRATWKKLMRENHPDSLAARGVPEAFIARASDKVARINAAWDQIKRERGL